MDYAKAEKTTRTNITKEKVVDIQLVWNIVQEKPYYSIRCKLFGENSYHIGYSSFNYENVLRWKDEHFVLVKEDAFMSVERSMEEIQERIHTINSDYSNDKELDSYKCALEVALDVLKKQVPQKPTLDDGANYVETYICPNCGNLFAGYKVSKYCYCCGQKFDWKEE